MADLELTLSVTDSVLTRPLLEGKITPMGVKLHAQPGKGMDTLSRQMLNLELDIGEMAISTFIKAREKGVPLVGLPLFTSGRRFLQAGILLSKQAGIRDLSDLRGRRVGVPQYWMSSSVWQRLLLQQMHGISPEDLSWVTTQPERMEELRIPPKVELRQDTSGRNPRELMQAGEVDVCMSPGGAQPGAQGGDFAVPAYPNWEAAQREYYQRTGIFPIMHMTAIKEELASREPWLLESLCDAYQEAKKQARAKEVPRSSEAPTAGETTKEMRDLMGDDPWPYGISPNRRPLEALVESALDQGLLQHRMKVDDFFAKGLPEKYR